MDIIKRHTLILFVLLLVAVLLLACQPSSTPLPSMSWQGLSDGQSVYGIVKLQVKILNAGISAVDFYLDEELLGGGTEEPDSVYTLDLFTQEVPNGSYTLLAKAYKGAEVYLRSEIAIDIHNFTRSEMIPSSAVKMTPENDPAPPVLAEAFRNIWYDPVPLEGAINTAGGEDSPYIMPDGQTFYFWFNGDESVDAAGQVDDPMTGIYVSRKQDGMWQEPERIYLQYFDELGFDGAQTVYGETMWFATIREGNYRDIDMWTARLVDGRWVDWANAGELLNKEYQIGQLHVCADGSEIYFDSTMAGGQGGEDIWMMRRVGGEWQEPENVTAVNTPGNEGQPWVSEDGTEMWFTGNYAGPLIYRSLKVGGEWQEPEMIVSSLAGEPTLDNAGNIYFTHHRWDPILNRVDEADIYVCYRK